jgi:hypothetical protein
MEIWILILAFGFISYIIMDIQMNRWMRQRHLRELRLAMEHPEFFSREHDVSVDEIRRAMTSRVTTYLPTGEVEVLGPGMIIFEEEKES